VSARPRTVTSVDPNWLDPEAYVAFLNQGFPGQWNLAAYRWYLTRPFLGEPTEILVRSRGGTLLAGLAMCYRQVAYGTGPPVGVCVLSSAITLPSERRRGHYAALLQTALERCRRRGWCALLAFARRDNTSGRGLIRLGARSIRSYYIGSQPAQRPSGRSAVLSESRCISMDGGRTLTRSSAWTRELYVRQGSEHCRGSRRPRLHFQYEQFSDWTAQFLQRPNPVRAFELTDGAVGLVEQVGKTDRLQLLDCSDEAVPGHLRMLSAASLDIGRKFFMFTVDQRAAFSARRARLSVQPGYLLVQPTGRASSQWATLERRPWRVHSGDRI
jgi:ribosomal protein S18 acetylase RimI-like enzyme